MDTSTSPDDALQAIDIVVLFLSDGYIAQYGGRWKPDEQFECGDLVHIERDPGSDSEDNANESIREYICRLFKWHGDENSKEVLVFGQLRPLGHLTVLAQNMAFSLE